MNAVTKQRQHLLIIDDNEAIHNDFAKIFACAEEHEDLAALDAELFGDDSADANQFQEYELSFASQGQEGLQVLKEALEKGVTFGAAFVDMRMPPGWDGVETIERLWEVDPDLQVVICTAFSDHSWDSIASRLGQTDKLLVLKKPFDEIEAVQLANALSEKRRLLDEDRRRMKQLEEELENQRSELKLSAGFASEINEPIQAISTKIRSAAETLDQLAELLDCLPAMIDDSISDEQLIELRNKISVGSDAHTIRAFIGRLPEVLTDSIESVETASRIVADMNERLMGQPQLAELS